MGVELVADKAKRTPFDLGLRIPVRIMKMTQASGLICRGLPGGNTIAFSPPLVISREEVDIVVERFGGTLDQAMDEFRKDAIWRG
jgi:adenosylmethionine-8-amino-7-oxononanoate aminotransferase